MLLLVFIEQVATRGILVHDVVRNLDNLRTTSYKLFLVYTICNASIVNVNNTLTIFRLNVILHSFFNSLKFAKAWPDNMLLFLLLLVLAILRL